MTKLDMMVPVLEVCPSFVPDWEEFLGEWAETDDKPIYIALGALARHLITMLAAGEVDTLTRVFGVVERWHTEGDAYVKEAAVIGLLEDLQNGNLHKTTLPAQFEPLLLPASLKSWRKVELFWSTGELITDE